MLGWSRPRWIAAAVATALAVLGMVLSSGDARGDAARLRTVLVARTAPAKGVRVGPRDCTARPRSCVNGVGGVELTFRVVGRIPSRPAVARVETDTNCAADENGISHCINRLRLKSGAALTVRHDHSMMNDPCLTPGELVRVVGI